MSEKWRKFWSVYRWMLASSWLGLGVFCWATWTRLEPPSIFMLCAFLASGMFRERL